jgi:hypothetical protein
MHSDETRFRFSKHGFLNPSIESLKRDAFSLSLMSRVSADADR